MIKEVLLRQEEGSLGTSLPKEMTDRLNLAAGDKAYVVATEHGILLTPHDPDMLRVLESEARLSQEYHNALRELAR
jgi:putative addiction module antidote